MKEAATYVAKPFDYASYGLGKKKETENTDEKVEVNVNEDGKESDDVKDNENEDVKYNENDDSNTIQECWANQLGYNCCKETCNIYFTDESGQWSIENDKWCGIIESQCKYECIGEITGNYPCCESCNVAYTDEDGQWGIENNKWCSIKSSF